MCGHHRTVWQLLVSFVAAAALATVPMDWESGRAAAADGCTLTPDIRATSCRLTPGQDVDGSVSADLSATYRIDVLQPDSLVELRMTGGGSGGKVSVLDWRGSVLGQGGADSTVSTQLKLPGVYGVRVDGDAAFKLSVLLPGADSPPRVLWPPELAGNLSMLTGERRVLRTPRAGTPEGGVAVARNLGSPPEGMLTDFTLVADVKFEQILGASALTVRFHYEPEAGGGSGYLLAIDPVAGTALIDLFEQGKRGHLVGPVPLPVEMTADAPNRLVVQAQGPNISVSLDGQPVISASDIRYPRGLVIVGAVTWSDPVAVTFDHLLVTAPN